MSRNKKKAQKYLALVKNSLCPTCHQQSAERIFVSLGKRKNYMTGVLCDQCGHREPAVLDGGRSQREYQDITFEPWF